MFDLFLAKPSTISSDVLSKTACYCFYCYMANSLELNIMQKNILGKSFL